MSQQPEVKVIKVNPVQKVPLSEALANPASVRPISNRQNLPSE